MKRKDIGIRELKARASEIVRKVAEGHGTYVITRRGRPAGVLVPAADVPGDAAVDSDHAWDRVEQLAERLSRNGRGHGSAVSELARMRR